MTRMNAFVATAAALSFICSERSQPLGPEPFELPVRERGMNEDVERRARPRLQVPAECQERPERGVGAGPEHERGAEKFHRFGNRERVPRFGARLKEFRGERSGPRLAGRIKNDPPLSTMLRTTWGFRCCSTSQTGRPFESVAFCSGGRTRWGAGRGAGRPSCQRGGNGRCVMVVRLLLRSGRRSPPGSGGSARVRFLPRDDAE